MRLFVALNLPNAVREAAWEAAAPLRARDWPVKWVRPEGIHLTLKFLGQVSPEQEERLRSALARAAAPEGADAERALTLVLRGFGAFPDARRPRVFWLGVEAEPALELLQHRVEREFAPEGFPTEARAFRPHVTLGRAARDARTAAFAGAADVLGALVFESSAVIDTVDLMESTLNPRGAVYHVRHRERLS